MGWVASHTGKVLCRIGLLSLLAVMALFQISLACDTPVYRYAMYRWQPAPYEVYYFHENAIAEEDRPTHQAINQWIDQREKQTNIVLLPVDLAADKELLGVPADVKEAWLAQEDKTLPTYFVYTPRGGRVFSGKLDSKSVQELIDSPARRKIAQQLEAGNSGVLLLLDGADDKASSETEKLVKQFIVDVAAGEISLYNGPGDKFGAPQPNIEPTPNAKAGDKAADGKTKKTEEPFKHKTGYVRVGRNDPKEAWLVRALLAVEPDLKDIKEPMVFAIYGRARALPPYIGKGITPDNLSDCIEFITSACSCTVKEQNPGVDLLVRHDWETASEILADKFGSEEGNETQFGGEFFPEIILSSGASPIKIPAPDKELANNQTTQGQTTQGQTTHGQTTQDGTTDEESSQLASADVSPKESSSEGNAGQGGSVSPPSREEQTQVAAANAAVAATTSLKVSADYGLLTIGIGVAVVLLALFGVTFYVLRPRH